MNFGIRITSLDSAWKMTQKILKTKSCEVTWPLEFLIFRFQTLMRRFVNTVTVNQSLIEASERGPWDVVLVKIWDCCDYVTWRIYEKSFFWTWAFLELLITQISTYAYISNWNFNATSMLINFFWFAYANFKKRDFLLNA